MNRRGRLLSGVTSRFPLLGGLVLVRNLDNGGWLRSRRAGRALSAGGTPLPWITYSAIHILSTRTPGDARVFEYGCGSSTLWWAARGNTIVACEHDRSWCARIATEAPNAHVLWRDLNVDYVSAARNFDPFDMIVIDGRRRVDCAKEAVHALTPAGVIVWDNAERERYQLGLRFLVDSGFRRLDLVGVGPVQAHASTTTIFYRDGNCLRL